MRKKNAPLWGPVLTAAVFLAAALWLLSALGSTVRSSGDEGRAQLELAVRRAATACYAAEGIYPPTLDYLVEHYGLQIGDRYVVRYDHFASNLIPDITVLEKDLP